MAVRTFLDSNVLIDLFDRDEGAKQARAREILDGLQADGVAVLSTQVLQEFYVSVTRKLVRPLPPREAARVLQGLLDLEVVQVDPGLILAAAEMSREETLSFWDALIVMAASAGACDVLLSEDMQHGRAFGGLRIQNPFRPEAGA